MVLVQRRAGLLEEDLLKLLFEAGGQCRMRGGVFVIVFVSPLAVTINVYVMFCVLAVRNHRDGGSRSGSPDFFSAILPQCVLAHS